jgi:hypothetical protein
VVRIGQRLLHYQRSCRRPRWWSKPIEIAADAAGWPSLTQGTWGKGRSPGNFELVTPLAGGGLAHHWRDNDDPERPWYRQSVFGEGSYTGASVIQGKYGPAGTHNLEVVASRAGDLLHYYRQGDRDWYGGDVFASGVSGAPSLIQGGFGLLGNFEVVTPMADGGLARFWRDNDGETGWHGPERFGTGNVTAASLIYSSYAHLEVVAIEDPHKAFYYRDDGGWYGPKYIAEDCIRVHAKVLYEPDYSIAAAFDMMQATYGLAGLHALKAGVESLDVPELN